MYILSWLWNFSCGGDAASLLDESVARWDLHRSIADQKYPEMLSCFLSFWKKACWLATPRDTPYQNHAEGCVSRIQVAKSHMSQEFQHGLSDVVMVAVTPRQLSKSPAVGFWQNRCLLVHGSIRHYTHDLRGHQSSFLDLLDMNHLGRANWTVRVVLATVKWTSLGQSHQMQCCSCLSCLGFLVSFWCVMFPFKFYGEHLPHKIQHHSSGSSGARGPSLKHTFDELSWTPHKLVTLPFRKAAVFHA